MAKNQGITLTGRELRLTTPLGEGQIRQLKVGDVILLNGMMYTGRDALHHHLLSHDSPQDLRGAALYHCGPVALKKGDRWTINAAGPTTSSREEPYQADIFEVRHPGRDRKGGMGKRTLAALKKTGGLRTPL
jgi:fumarate hydratase class I